MKQPISLLLAAGLLLGGTNARAQDAAALLDLLVRKGIVTQQEAKNLRTQLAADHAKTASTTTTTITSSGTTTSGPEKKAGDKLKLSTPLTELEIFGDVRVRYDNRSGETAGSVPVAAPGPGVAGLNDTQQRERERYRIRLGLRGTLADDWFFGLRLETSTSPRSTNVTIGDDTRGNGPFAKTSDSINVGQAYVGYKGLQDFTFTLGRMPNPLVNTWMTWDPDINPEGVAEQWKHTFKLGGGSGESYSKDGKSVAAPIPGMTLDLFANLGQFIYDDANPENPLGGRATTRQIGATTSQLVPNTDAWMMAWQAGARLTLPNSFYVQLAPTLYNYGGNGDDFNIYYQGGSPTLTNAASLAQNQIGINSLLVFDMPAEIGWKVNKLPMRIFGDFAANLEADARARASGNPGKGDQRYAYVIGAGIGQQKKKHDWQVEAFWERTDQYSLDPNLIDDDIFDAHLNMQGPGVRASYNLTDAVFISATYNYGSRADDSLGTGGAGAIGINPVDHYQLFMADLNLKF